MDCTLVEWAVTLHEGCTPEASYHTKVPPKTHLDSLWVKKGAPFILSAMETKSLERDLKGLVLLK